MNSFKKYVLSMKKIYPYVSPEDKRRNSLVKHIESLCVIFSIRTSIDYLYSFINDILCQIYKIQGPKRGKVRDSIICLILSRVCPCVTTELITQKLDLSMKYIRQANDLLLETSLQSSSEITFPFHTEPSILLSTQTLIDKCIQNDIFIHSSHKSIVSVCLYKSLLDHNYLVDSYKLSHDFGISQKLLLSNLRFLENTPN